jgi:hypothetical protein
MRFSQNSFFIPWLYVHTASAQIEYELVYDNNFVRYAEGAECAKRPPQVNFITSLKNTHYKIKLENSPPGESAGDSRVVDRSVSSSVSLYPFDIKNWVIIRKPQSYPGMNNIPKYSRLIPETTDLLSPENPFLSYFLKNSNRRIQ